MYIVISDDANPVEAAALLHTSVNILQIMESHASGLQQRCTELWRDRQDMDTLIDKMYDLARVTNCPVCQNKDGIRFVINPFDPYSSREHYVMCVLCTSKSDSYSILDLAIDDWNDLEVIHGRK